LSEKDLLTSVYTRVNLFIQWYYIQGEPKTGLFFESLKLLYMLIYTVFQKKRSHFYFFNNSVNC